MSFLRKYLINICASFAACIVMFSANADPTFPNRPINLVVAFGPGTGSDTIARILSEKMREILGTPVTVENRLGGGGVIGTEYVARAKPDGYTLTMGTTSSLGTTPVLNPNAKYDVKKDFAFISGLAKSDYVIFTSTRPGSPQTLGELLDRLKKEPSSFASAGVGTITHLATEMLLHKASVSATHIPYKGSGQVIVDVAAGQVLFATDSPSAALPLIQAGKLRALAVTGPTRLGALPDVPTVAESGFPSFQVLAWWCLAAPAGTPEAVIKKLSDAAQKAVASPEITDRLRKMEIEPMLMNAAELTDFINKDIPVWTNFIRSSGITIAP
ncbi:MAG: tripartite tricarboxylate transporter substrate binding protein [Candidatus Methylopumilus sp.]|nr:tripartite tricarboxylate transporter substrate binding protein [Candidatus Methylopumilus sp.]